MGFLGESRVLVEVLRDFPAMLHSHFSIAAVHRYALVPASYDAGTSV